MFFRLAASLFFALTTTLPAWSAPISYALDTANSVVGYELDFDQDVIRGSIPVADADVRLDFRGGASTVRVTLNAAAATSSFPFAEQALKGPKVLATGQFPQITFVAEAFRFSQTGATVPGTVTIRGVTRPVSLTAQVYRQQGTEAGDLSKMSVHLSGVVSRAAFGATGWSDMVDDEVRIKIVARLDQAS